MHATNSQPALMTGAGMIHIPAVIPIFPLPQAVLLPGEVMPLHIFEERYREMTRDAIGANRVVGICQLTPGFEHLHAGNPPIEAIGCAGFIGGHEQMDDGRYLIWLFGLERFEVEEEMVVTTPYRQAKVSYTLGEPSAAEAARLQPLRRELRELLPSIADSDDETKSTLAAQLGDLDDAQLIALASQLLVMPVARKRQLLEAASSTDRFLLVFEDLYSHLERHPDVGSLESAILN